MTVLLGGGQPIPGKGSSGLTEVVGERINCTGHERQCGLLGRPLDGESGDLGSGPIPATHLCSDPAWSLPSLGFCFPIHSMGAWSCLGVTLSFGAWPG